jgi:hypothetical protein
MRQDEFSDALAFGRRGEMMVFNWLKTRGWGVIPSYDYTGSDGSKAPRLQYLDRAYPVPDGDICNGTARIWIEIKTYTYAPMNRKVGEPVHGAAKRLIESYLRVEKDTLTPVWIAVLEIKTGALLVARLADLDMLPCQCSPCRTGSEFCCVAPIKRGLYWRRSQMSEATVFGDEEMKPLRAEIAARRLSQEVLPL